MMTQLCSPPSVLSSPQRRCQMLLMLYLPGTVTPELIGQINGVDGGIARQDIVETSSEIQRYHRLSIMTHPDGSYRIEGAPLDRRLCLLHWLRRAMRLCPHFVQQHFTPTLKTELRQRGIPVACYDDTNLHALVNLCGRRLNRQFESRDTQFLRLFLQYCLMEQHAGQSPGFSEVQNLWTAQRVEYLAAQEIMRHWQRRVPIPPHQDEQLFLALIFMMLRVPDPLKDNQPQDIQLRLAVAELISAFRQLSGMAFSDETGLAAQLYVHLAQALDRCLFGIGIDNALPEEITRLYPRLMRTTREACARLETHYGIQFSDEEIGLIAIIFGAWLMQESDIQEKQVLLLTGNDRELEEQIEHQLRELTLLPLNIKYLSVHTFQKEGASKEVALIITPYHTSLPLFSAPLIHATLPLGEHQQQRIREILES
ncbi:MULTISPECIES: stationary phase inducible protein CsiE [Atlantibacter]|uniref:stationary phase inducible protein CsiE n=1 Tax=Atlantibacter TaxID=1903434 RepID=UPI0019325266|nr:MULTISPECIES: stationary phase inducible protein CsiE [Atlantibacter]MBL7635825.1 stationary phase inducible protein CsiE [Atlantibacter hermannii]MBL7674040.1 stationary phase inducible protein CsiE [Atlantibacter hermannii]